MLSTEATPSLARAIKGWQRYALCIAVLGQLFLAGDWYGFAAVITFVSKDLSLSPTEAGFIQGAFAITYCAGMLFWSPFARHWSSRKLFAIGLLGTGVFMLAQAMAGNFTEMVAARLLIGFFDAAVWVGTMKLIVGWFPASRHGATMGILLAAEIVERLTHARLPDFLAAEVFRPLGMKRSVLGLGCFRKSEMVSMQTEHAATEAGAGKPGTQTWDWNSDYWRNLAAPWGGAHSSAADVATFLHSFLQPAGKVLRHPKQMRRLVMGQAIEGVYLSDHDFTVPGRPADHCQRRHDADQRKQARQDHRKQMSRQFLEK